MQITYTAKYTEIESGYMGQVVEWPEVVTEGVDLEDCQAMLSDALHEMILAYKQLGKELPSGGALVGALVADVCYVRPAQGSCPVSGTKWV